MPYSRTLYEGTSPCCIVESFVRELFSLFHHMYLHSIFSSKFELPVKLKKLCATNRKLRQRTHASGLTVEISDKTKHKHSFLENLEKYVSFNCASYLISSQFKMFITLPQTSYICGW